MTPLELRAAIMVVALPYTKLVLETLALTPAAENLHVAFCNENQFELMCDLNAIPRSDSILMGVYF